MPFVCLLLLLGAGAVGNAEEVDRTDRALPESIANLRLDAPITVDGAAFNIDPALIGAQGVVRVSVRLTQDPVAAIAAAGGSPGQQRAQLRAVRTQQSQVRSAVAGLDGRAIGSAQRALNVVFVEIDASQLAQLAANPNVVSIAPVIDYELDLFETVPYIGATAAQGMGYDGSGVKVAVLDSGIDYTHAALGGSGDPADHAANDPTIIEPGTFPTAKVVGGYDFVGEAWMGGAASPPEAPDPDPLGKGSLAGHGTHVAHIIAGVGGVAPGASLYAVKVCSSVSTACSGIALIQGMDFALDPNGDANLSDRVDIINMSLGSPYGTAFDDDLSQAVENATAVGVLTVASAGNSSDKPYAVGTPSAAPSALSVAQTAVPSAVLPLMEILAPSAIAGLFPAVFQPWSAPLTAAIEAPLQYGDGAGGNTLGCTPFAAGSLSGKIVLVLRGSCNFTLKIKNIGDAGGLVGIIGLIAPGDPFEGGDGGDRPITIPGYMVSQAVSNRLRSGLPNTVVRFDPAVGIELMGSMVGSSSRGPSMGYNLIKPEIGAPGASVSAIYGTGTGEGPFGGTSGAAPMVAGSAALVMDAYPNRSPLEVKAVLMNTAYTEVVNDPLTGALAPISRIGGGEVRVDRAVASPIAAWDSARPSGGLSFGYVDVWKDVTVITRTVVVRNYSNQAVNYSINPSFRFADDAASGAVEIQTPGSIRVPAGQTRTFTVKVKIYGALLPGNYMNSGSMGASPAALNLNEFDGYITLAAGSQSIHLPWHMLPRQSARVTGRPVVEAGAFPDVIDLTNTGVGIAQNDAYALVAISPDIPEGPIGEQSPTPDIAAVGVNTFPVPAGFCSANPSFLWAFAVNTHERQSHLLPVSHQIILDTNQDGTADYIVLNRDASGLGSITDGRQLAWALNLGTGSASAFFYAEHATNTGNTALYICAEQIGMNAANLLVTQVDMEVYSQDFYFGGPGDEVTGITITPLGERFYGVPEDIPGKGYGTLAVYDFGPWPGNTPELGIMLFTNGDRVSGARGGATEATEALLFLAR